MTKKDYVKLAAAIHATLKDVQVDEQPWVPFFTVVDAIAATLAADNAAFDRDRFVAACKGGAA